MSKHDKAWNNRFEQLVEYKNRFGNCSVPLRFKSNPSLGRWVNRQREARNKQILCWERETLLNEIGFEWNQQASSPSVAWKARFDELVEFKKEHHHCNVPQNYGKRKGLGGWVNRQRTAMAKGTLLPEREKLLESIDFSWNMKNDAWDIRYAQLLKYKIEYGNCDVPHGHNNTELSKWVQKQRYLATLKKKGTKTNLTDDREQKLNELGFEWHPSNTSWDNQYKKLCEYKAKHGNCHVPRPYPADPKLSNWVFNQRSEYSRKQRGMKNSLTVEREAKLDTLNFRWAIMGKKKGGSSPDMPNADVSRPLSLPNGYQPMSSHPPAVQRHPYAVLLPHYQWQQRITTLGDHIRQQEQIIVSKLLQLRG
eukprot:CAMPEP_0113601508 /NCGR_PEP_ID=MMETSP0017_2-20120614/266_1 /TAXON_ID=2856 /ORGANISM="Cylindrotheca closterium" /LENGTH=364 /DNA_ID=CAMNT_0000509805 /DNA_START=24 /DNA_END=1118 /DNA_ORIENTATION=- /assembly_acc=CAM_ASM_000147